MLLRAGAPGAEKWLRKIYSAAVAEQQAALGRKPASGQVIECGWEPRDAAR
jgi:hypothetical protein